MGKQWPQILSAQRGTDECTWVKCVHTPCGMQSVIVCLIYTAIIHTYIPPGVVLPIQHVTVNIYSYSTGVQGFMTVVN